LVKSPGEVRIVEVDEPRVTRFVLEVDVEGSGKLTNPYILARLTDALDRELNRLHSNGFVPEDWTFHTKWTRA